MDLNKNAKYGHPHKELRKRYAILIDNAGSIPCARCGEPITRGMRWDLGHTDGAGPRVYNGPVHPLLESNRRPVAPMAKRRQRQTGAGPKPKPAASPSCVSTGAAARYTASSAAETPATGDPRL